MNEARLNLIKVATRLTVTDTLFRTQPNEVYGNLLATFEAYVASEKQSPFIYTTPDSWWQMFKDQYFPGWLIKRFPVALKRHEISVKTVYPFLKTQLPAGMHGSPVRIAFNDVLCGSFMEGGCATPQEMMERKAELFSQQIDSFCPRCHQKLDWK